MSAESGASRRWISRRSVIAVAGVSAGGIAGHALAEGALPGRAFVFGHLGLDGPDGVIPQVAPGSRVDGSFVSQARGGLATGWTIALPPGARSDGRGLPVAVVLHGKGASHSSAFSEDYLGLDRFLSAAVEGGATPFAIASVDGGDSYWHTRADGEDSAAMVVDEFLPLLAKKGLDVERLALLGWSMGGYGALRLAAHLGREQVVAATAMSPALWLQFADSAPGAFDDEADFERSNIFGHQRELDGTKVRIDCGEEDPFYSATEDYVHGFPNLPAGGFQPGSHDVGYWRRMAPAHVQFIADAFA